MKPQKASIFILILSGVLLSCNQTPEHVPPTEIAMVIGDPVEYGSKDYMLFPVGGNYNPKINQHKEESDLGFFSSGELKGDDAPESGLKLQKRDVNYNNSLMQDRDASYEFGNANESDFDIRNLLFYNKQTGV